MVEEEEEHKEDVEREVYEGTEIKGQRHGGRGRRGRRRTRRERPGEIDRKKRQREEKMRILNSFHLRGGSYT